MFDRLLAKSQKSGVTLVQHTQDVIDAFRALFGDAAGPTRLGACWTRFFCLNSVQVRGFYDATLSAAALHDIGKANDGFQDVVRGKGAQNIRHEHLSGLMISLPSMCDWLAGLPNVEWDVVLAAVISHHLKVKEQSFASRPAENTRVRLRSDHDDFEVLLRLVATELNLPGPLPDLGNPVWDWTTRPNRFSLQDHADRTKQHRLKPFRRALRDDEDRRRLLNAVRSALIVADAVGSARYRLGDMNTWLADVFDSHALCTETLIQEKVIARRVAQIRRTKGTFCWNEFQSATADLAQRALLLAPCGSGKTLAAWRWIAQRCAEQPVQRVLFLYPTRATATEGFRDYVSWAPEAGAMLMHGSASYDLEGMFSNCEEGDWRTEAAYEVDERLFALGSWTRRIFSATVDQFLSFLQYAYGAVCQIPILADSVIVVDEVHSFDSAMFSALCEFLKNFSVPVLCMTATLPRLRRDVLQKECGLEVYNEKPGRLATIADAPRYHVEQIAESEVRQRVQDALNNGRRVLWVVNRVASAQQLTRELALNLDDADLFFAPNVPLLCYHSRFRLQDRKVRHEQVVEAFQGERRPVLAIATQVCEMSLDLDADLLVTERAPIASLIQRMGRCNRVPDPRSDGGGVLAYRTGSERPYTPASLSGVDDFLEEISALETVSQSQLDAAMAKAPSPTELPRDCQFLSSGPYAHSGEESFRDIEQFTVPAVLTGDLAEFEALGRQRKSIDGLVVPVPRRFRHSHAHQRPIRFPDWLSVAPSVNYHRALGFCDEQIQQAGPIIL